MPDIGDFVCDMHDGLPDKASMHVVIDTPNSSEALLLLLPGDPWTTNKYAYIIGETRDGLLQCAYSYDGMKLGFFCVPFPTEDNRCSSHSITLLPRPPRPSC